jgi:hypothetical protein
LTQRLAKIRWKLLGVLLFWWFVSACFKIYLTFFGCVLPSNMQEYWTDNITLIFKVLSNVPLSWIGVFYYIRPGFSNFCLTFHLHYYNLN